MPGASRANQFHQRPREESRARTPPEKTDRQSRLRNRIHELEDSQTTSLVFLFSSLSSSSINHLPIPIDHLPFFPFLFPSTKARLLYTHACRDLFSGHPERDPSLFTLLRHSSRNQRYKYARTVGCWLRFQGTAKESRGAISFTRELVSAGAKMILPAPFSTNRATLSVSFPTKIHPVYPPPLYQPSLRYLNERNLERRKKRNNCNRKSTTGKKLKREEWWSVTRRTKGRPFAEKLRAKRRERRRTKRDGNGGGIEMREIRQEEVV